MSDIKLDTYLNRAKTRTPNTYLSDLRKLFKMEDFIKEVYGFPYSDKKGEIINLLENFIADIKDYKGEHK